MEKIYKENGGNKATLNKWYKICKNNRRSGKMRYLEIGFSNWYLRKKDDSHSSDFGEYTIEAYTNYHVESTLDRLYENNGKNWY